MALNRNVYSHKLQFSNDPEKTLHKAFAVLLEKEGFGSGDQVVVISDALSGSGIDAVQVRELP